MSKPISIPTSNGKGAPPAPPARTDIKAPAVDPAVMAEVLAQIEALRAENAALKSKATSQVARSLSLRVSTKGALSVYGLGRFPVTLYREQWTRLLERADDIKQYIAANADKLSTKE